MSARPKNLRTIFVCLLLALGTLALFWPVIHCDFVNYDDPDYASQNPMIQQGLTGQSIAWAFQKSFASNWHPLTWMSHMIDWQIYGVKPGGHHLTNLIFHIATTLLLFFVLKKMTDAFWRSALVAALFAIHPLHVESVAWISERKDVLSGFFAVLTIWAYGRYVEMRAGEQVRKRESGSSTNRSLSHFLTFYFLALIFFALGLMSKPMLVTLPCVLLLLDFWPLKRMTNDEWPKTNPKTKAPRAARSASRTSNFTGLLVEKIPFFALTAVSCVVTYFAQHAEAMEHWDALPLGRRLANAVISYVRYVGKTLWPSDLSVFYSYPDAWPEWQVIGAALLLMAVTVAIILSARARPWLAVGWFWFIGILVPVIGIVQVGIQSIADRYMYLPGIGLFLMLAWSLPELDRSRSRAKFFTIVSASFLVLAGCALTTLAQLRHWQNSATLFQHALNVDRSNVVAHVMFAQTLDKDNKPDEAIAHYREALQIKPGFPQMYYNIGNVLVEQKKYAEAETNYAKALEMKPDYPEVHYNFGIVSEMQGKFAQAVEHYATALQGIPDDATLRQYFGSALVRLGKFDQAIEQFDVSIKLKPDSPETHFYWGMALAAQKKKSEAAAHFNEALRLKPDYAEARKQLELLGLK